VSDARTHLEVARTDNAAGALAPAKDQLKVLNENIGTVQAADPTHVTLTAEIVGLVPSSAKPGQATAVQITIENANLDQIRLDDIKVQFGPRAALRAEGIVKPDSVNAPHKYTVVFIAPKDRPDSNLATYAVALTIQGRRVEGQADGEGKRQKFEFAYE
jgi:hypothetical protein